MPRTYAYFWGEPKGESQHVRLTPTAVAWLDKYHLTCGDVVEMLCRNMSLPDGTNANKD
jgi:hypothetical protein